MSSENPPQLESDLPDHLPQLEGEVEEELPAQSLVSHLVELRNRLMRAVIVLLVILVALIGFTEPIFDTVATPLLKHLPEGTNSSMVVINIHEAFLTPFKLTFFVAIFASMPFLLYQIWAYVAPALYQKEKRLAVPILLSSILLFYLGVGFAYFVVFPLIFEFFVNIAPGSVTVMPDITSHLNLVIKLFFAFGLAFEIPVRFLLCDRNVADTSRYHFSGHARVAHVVFIRSWRVIW